MKTNPRPMTEEQMIAWIDSASAEQVIRKFRFAGAGDPFFQGIVGWHFGKRMFALHNADPAEWSRVSFRVGWNR